MELRKNLQAAMQTGGNWMVAIHVELFHLSIASAAAAWLRVQNDKQKVGSKEGWERGKETNFFSTSNGAKLQQQQQQLKP